MVTTKQVLSRVLAGAQYADEVEAKRKLVELRKQLDDRSIESWSGHTLRVFMEWVSGRQLDERTFTRWKRIAGISAFRKQYGHGSFVLATAIGQLKKEGQRVVTARDVANRLGKIDHSLGVKLMMMSVSEGKEDDGGEKISGKDLPKAVAKYFGDLKPEIFYYRNVPGYSRTLEYSPAQVLRIATLIHAYCSPENNQGGRNGKKARKPTRTARGKTTSRKTSKARPRQKKSGGRNVAAR